MNQRLVMWDRIFTDGCECVKDSNKHLYNELCHPRRSVCVSEPTFRVQIRGCKKTTDIFDDPEW